MAAPGMVPVLTDISTSDGDLLLTVLKRGNPKLVVDAISGTPAVGNGQNMVSVVTRVSLVGHDLDTGEEVTLSLIMKRPPESTERRELFLCDAAFHNEATFYSDVLPRLGYDLKLPFAPCLLGTDDVIVLRDLRQDGFAMADRRTGLDLEHCCLVLQELGRFHALSYAMKHLEPEEFCKLSGLVKEVFIHKENVLLIECIDFCIDMAVKASTTSDTPVIVKLKSLRGKGIEILTPHVVAVEPDAVICHGDFHSNNILFRYANNNRTPTDAGFVDLQGSRYASPALDILYFIFSSGSSEVLKHHFKTLMSVYQSSLMDRLENLAPSGRIPSLKEVMIEVRKRIDYGLVMSILMLPMVVNGALTLDLNTTTLGNLAEAKEEVKSSMIDDEYKCRINSLFQLITEEKLIDMS